MSGSDKHACKLCGNETYEIYGYPFNLPEVIPFKFYDRSEDNWTGINLRICPKCGHVQGEVIGND